MAYTKSKSKKCLLFLTNTRARLFHYRWKSNVLHLQDVCARENILCEKSEKCNKWSNAHAVTYRFDPWTCLKTNHLICRRVSNHWCIGLNDWPRSMDKILTKQITQLHDQTNIIVDDVRYENEIVALRNMGFTILYMDTMGYSFATNRTSVPGRPTWFC